MLQTNSFSEQMQQQNQINTLSTAKNLILTSAIISTIFSVPGFAFLISSTFQIPMFAFLVLSIFTLIFAKKARQSIIGSTLSIIANILSFLTFFILIYIATLSTLNNANSAIFLYIIAFLITWAMYISATIVLFIEFNSANKVLLALQHYNLQQNFTQQTPPFTMPAQTIETPQPFTQSNESPKTNPFITQPESATTPTPLVNQEHIQQPHIPTPSQQNNPFLTEKE